MKTTKTTPTATAVSDFIGSLNTWFSLEENESDALGGFGNGLRNCGMTAPQAN